MPISISFVHRLKCLHWDQQQLQKAKGEKESGPQSLRLNLNGQGGKGGKQQLYSASRLIISVSVSAKRLYKKCRADIPLRGRVIVGGGLGRPSIEYVPAFGETE